MEAFEIDLAQINLGSLLVPLSLHQMNKLNKLAVNKAAVPFLLHPLFHKASPAEPAVVVYYSLECMQFFPDHTKY